MQVSRWLASSLAICAYTHHAGTRDGKTTMSWPALLLALLAALVGYVLLTVKVNTAPSDFSRLDVAGPVIAGCSTGINLDGLSLSRTVRLPTVTIKLPGLGSLKIKAISSELVFPQLRLADVRVTASDAIKQGIAVSAIVDTSLTGSCAVKTDLVSSSNIL